MKALSTVIIGSILVTLAVSCSSEKTCTDLVREKYSRDNKFVEQTFSDGDFFKGIVGQYTSGSESIFAHWECSIENGEPKITFFELAS